MYQFDKIKLVIWDLDETFWSGTLSEGKVSIPKKHRDLLLRLTDIGIVNSICSKNDWLQVKQALEHQKLLDYFVFPSVNWEAKGGRVKQLIQDMRLRPANVLFIDDNPSNREEVRYFCPEIMLAEPSEIPNFLCDAMAAEVRDPEHKRLHQYRVLEEKYASKSQYASNEAFLMESNIQVTISTDCQKQIERIHDLLFRANQLNFTKLRSSTEEIQDLLADSSVQAGYVSVTDRFGDYGIVGFYALKNDALIHFTFSCRTLGMGIEQYVYNILNRPKLEIVGEVISDLSNPELPKWINQQKILPKKDKMEIQNLKNHSVLIKGPCDLFQIFPYIAQTEMIDTEFTHVVDGGLTIESTGHTTHIVEALRLTDVQKERVVSEVPFTAKDIYNKNIYTNNYKVVILSILADANLGVYRRKNTGERFAFLEYLHPITDRASWDGLIRGEYNCGGFHFTEQILQKFAQDYEFIGRNSPEQIVENLQYIRANLPKDCVLAIMLGGELYYEKNTFPAYQDRHIVHRRINQAIRNFADETENVRLIDVNQYLVDQSSFYDHFNHYIKPVYYQLAKEIVELINECTGSDIRETSKLKIVQIRLKEMLAPIYYKLRRMFVRGN